MTKVIELSIPEAHIDSPIIYQIVTKYNLIPNIIEAHTTNSKMGFVRLELNGKPKDIESSMLYLRELDITITEIDPK